MSNNDVVVKQQDEIRLYEEDGGIVMVQKNWPEDDSVIYFNVESAEIIAQAIIELHAKIMRGE